MPPDPDRPAAEWFAEAEQCYFVGHQACAWCGGRHCVFRRERDARLEYSCMGCDFTIYRDCHTGHVQLFAGSPVERETNSAAIG